MFYASLNERLYGGLTPLAVRGRAGDRRVVAVATTLSGCRAWSAPWLERDAGLLRWAPVVALVLLGAWLLWRSRRVRLARLVAEQRDAEHAAFLALAVCGAQLLAAAFTDAVARRGLGRRARRPRCRARSRRWPGGCGTRRCAGWALGALTLAGSLWLLVEGAWSASSDAPWGPIVRVFPVDGSAGDDGGRRRRGGRRSLPPAASTSAVARRVELRH